MGWLATLEIRGHSHNVTRVVDSSGLRALPAPHPCASPSRTPSSPGLFAFCNSMQVLGLWVLLFLGYRVLGILNMSSMPIQSDTFPAKTFGLPRKRQGSESTDFLGSVQSRTCPHMCPKNCHFPLDDKRKPLAALAE